MSEKKLVTRSVAIILGLLCILLLGSTVGTVIYYNNAYNNYASNHTHTDTEYLFLASLFANANENISSLNNQLSTLQSELAGNSTQSTNLKAQVDALTSQLGAINASIVTIQDYYNSLVYVYSTDSHDLAVQLDSARSQITSLQSQVDSLSAIANLTASTTWVNNQTVTQPAGSYTTWSESASYAGYVSITVSSSTSSTYANVAYSSHGVNYNVQTNVGTNGTAYFPVLPSSNITVAVGNGLSTGSATETVTILYYY
jgi:predicted  nucleic acid-binding Zn-ribbon protein